MRLAVIADTHVVVGDRAHEHVEWHNTFQLEDSRERLATAIAHSHLRDADVLVILGDLVHFGDRPSLEAVVDIVRSYPAPVVLLSGNHDVGEHGVRLEDVIADAGSAASNVWSPLSARPPTAVQGLFDAAGIGLQVIEVTSMWPTPSHPFGVEARVVVDAPLGSPGMTMTHFPLLDFQRRCEEAGFLYSGHLAQLAEAPDLDRGWAPHIVLNGHLHVRAVETQGSTLQLSFAALIEAPYDIATLDIERRGAGVDLSYVCVSVRPVDEARVPVLDGPEARWEAFTGAQPARGAVGPSK
jgi:predicted phosphodiesterase